MSHRPLAVLVLYASATLLESPALAAEPPRNPPAPGSMEPDLTPPAARRDWQTEHRFLQAGTGISWALVGLGTLGMAIPLGMLSRCNAANTMGADVNCADERRAAGVTAPILAVMTLASLVPAVLFTRRLVKHKKERSTARLHMTPGGLAVQF